MLILLAEDDLKIAKLLIHLFNKDGYQLDYAKDGVEALMYAEMNQYDVIILDWMMPHKSGIEVCNELRRTHYSGGILMLTAKDTLDDKIKGLETGADDYLSKPFEYRELLARVKALSRRSVNIIKDDLLVLGAYTLDRQHMRVMFEQKDLELSNREFQVFSLLLENNRRVVPREVLIDRVWGIDQEVSQNNLDAFIRLLRKKIEKSARENVIINIRGIGYKVEV